MEVPGKEGEEDRSGGRWITSGTTCRNPYEDMIDRYHRVAVW